MTSQTSGTRAPKVPGGWSPPFSAPPQSPALARQVDDISSLVRRAGRPHGRPGRPTSPLPCTNPVPLALHADRWPCGPAVTQYTAAWRALGANPPSWHVSRRSDGAFCSLLLSFQAERPPPGGRGRLDVANQGNRGPESTRQVVPPLLCPPQRPRTCARGPTFSNPMLPPFHPLNRVMGGTTAALADRRRPSPALTLYPWPSMQIAGRVAQR